MVTNSVDTIVSGHLCIDFIPQMDNVPLEGLSTPGKLFDVGPMTFGTGGAVSNTGLALHRLGVNVRLMATVGDDLIGQAIISLLNQRDPTLGQLISTQPGQASSYSVVLSPARADRIFLHHTGTNAHFDASHINFDLLRQARLFHLGYPPILPRLMLRDGEQLTAIYRQARATGVVTSLDMALPDPDGPAGQVDWMKILRSTLPYVDVFLPSIEEIVFMVRRADFDRWQGRVLGHITRPYLSGLADELLAMGSTVVGLKLGAMGFYLKTAEDVQHLTDQFPLRSSEWSHYEGWHAPFAAEVASTVGAGDAAIAGFLASLLRGLPPQEALRWACAVGACCVEAADATSGVRSWQETQNRLDDGWERLEVQWAATDP
ncbi:MAG: carbohydrate kinase family protein [Anaerolineae bacterium]|nr:carbohydrate kinase family protein [Anaerolineae bacterium]